MKGMRLSYLNLHLAQLLDDLYCTLILSRLDTIKHDYQSNLIPGGKKNRTTPSSPWDISYYKLF